MSHPRVEEVSDSDMSDPSEGDIDDFNESDILRQITKPSAASSSDRQPQAQPPLFPQAGPGAAAGVRPPPNFNQKQIADYQCIYPVYFDATRTRAEGRRVPKSLAVENPLAQEIANFCASKLRLQTLLEAHRVHPKDWANPGRVRIKLKDPANPFSSKVNGKHHLYILIAEHLKANPTTEDSDALRKVKIPGLPTPEKGKEWPKPAVPRGWKMGTLLPIYSAAMTGGGVSENAFKDMMKEMGGMPGGAGGLPPGMGGMAEMMNMFGGGGGGDTGPPAVENSKKGKKGKGKG